VVLWLSGVERFERWILVSDKYTESQSPHVGIPVWTGRVPHNPRPVCESGFGHLDYAFPIPDHPEPQHLMIL
jgi:hypothetical protein